MKKVIIDISKNEIKESEIPENTPVFAKKDGRLAGMIVKEGRGWILRIGGDAGSNGFWPSREQLIETALGLGHEFFIED